MRRIRHSRALLVGALIASTGLFGEVALASADQSRSLPPAHRHRQTGPRSIASKWSTTAN